MSSGSIAGAASVTWSVMAFLSWVEAKQPAKVGRVRDSGAKAV
jgi:hypothetical protein